MKRDLEKNKQKKPKKVNLSRNGDDEGENESLEYDKENKGGEK